MVNTYAQASQLQTCMGSSLEEDIANKVRGGVGFERGSEFSEHQYMEILRIAYIGDP